MVWGLVDRVKTLFRGSRRRLRAGKPECSLALVSNKRIKTDACDTTNLPGKLVRWTAGVPRHLSFFFFFLLSFSILSACSSPYLEFTIIFTMFHSSLVSSKHLGPSGSDSPFFF
ncbi:hypothetical protein ASPBRDRAFT_336611 [Aspergillus brasiliensis CBS 101740]|uniref:Uncharacterized protein n=1 Tax=Aspergillus brasiliensis (strain CBS 101740 / IMI 381727 / IBT 21946) TaxID=767769 RepID=A0A1L9U867_ASPBC|nr:hypothetical protein ASPBRDRAFT_336611 [Aspergillus brasiliensis CBS 101740]